MPSTDQNMGQSKPKHAMGRPRTKTPLTFTDEQLQRIDDYATAQAKDTTIAEAMEMDVKTFQKDFSKRCRHKRAEGKLRVLEAQLKQTQNNPVAAIWFGKQHLKQSDKGSLDVDIGNKLKGLLDWLGKRQDQ